MMLNVRLSRAEEQIVRGLRKRRVNVSALVRKGLASAAASMLEDRSVSAVAELEAILRDVPVARPRRASRRPPLDDRLKVRAFIREKLRRR